MWPLIALSIAACRTAAPAPDLVEESRLAMGSVLRIAIWTAERGRASEAIGGVFAEFDRLDRALSVWHPESDVSRLNAAAGQGPVRVGPDTLRVLESAIEAGEATGGKFDVTFGALSDVWRFDHDLDGVVPTPEAIARRLPLVDYTAVAVDSVRGTAEIRRAGVRVHLGGIGKGHAVDRGAALLRAAGFANFLIQSGGDLYASGTRGERPWRAGVADPRDASGGSFASIDLRDETFSTSGDYERAFMKEGTRYHHILDPDTGQPARLCRSVTIVATSALTADWVSTGVFVLGPEEGMRLVESLPQVEAVIVTAGNDVQMSSGLRTRLRVERPPTP